MVYSYEPHHFEEFEEGQTFRSPGRTITETDVVMHAATTSDWNELYTNEEFARERDFDGRIVHGPRTSRNSATEPGQPWDMSSSVAEDSGDRTW